MILSLTFPSPLFSFLLSPLWFFNFLTMLQVSSIWSSTGRPPGQDPDTSIQNDANKKPKRTIFFIAVVKSWILDNKIIYTTRIIKLPPNYQIWHKIQERNKIANRYYDQPRKKKKQNYLMTNISSPSQALAIQLCHKINHHLPKFWRNL